MGSFRDQNLSGVSIAGQAMNETDVHRRISTVVEHLHAVGEGGGRRQSGRC